MPKNLLKAVALKKTHAEEILRSAQNDKLMVILRPKAEKNGGRGLDGFKIYQLNTFVLNKRLKISPQGLEFQVPVRLTIV